MNPKTLAGPRMFRKPFLLLAIVAACKGSESKIPDAPASITGRVTVLQQTGDGGTVRVEANPDSVTGTSAMAVVRITPTTTVIAPKTGPADFSALNTGQWVRVWFVGPVRQSQPLQANAGTVVIDSTGGRQP